MRHRPSLPRLFLLLPGLLAAWGAFSCTGTDTGNPLADGTDTGNPMLQTAVQGVLHDSLGEPFVNAEVTLRPLPPGAQALAKGSAVGDTLSGLVRFTTDASGAFWASGLREGPYALVAVSKGQGLLIRFSVKARDTLDLPDHLQAFALTDVVWPVPASLKGQTLRVAELGIDLLPDRDTLRLSSVPAGAYTLLNQGGNPVAIAASPGFSPEISSSSGDVSSSSVPGPLSLSSSSAQDPLSSATESSSSSLEASSSSEHAASSSAGISSSGGSASLSVTDARDDRTYGSVSIVDLYWFTSDLRYGSASTDSVSPGAYYTFESALTACPEGWHLPSTLEWSSLVTMAGGTAMAGATLKAKSNWPSGNGIDMYGLSIYPTGTANSPSDTTAWFWTATDSANGTAQVIRFSAASSSISYTSEDKASGIAVRCVKSTLTENDN